MVTVEREKTLAQSTKNILAPSNLYNFQHCECGRSHKCVQFSRSVVSDSCDPMNRSTPGLPVHHQLPEFTQTHDHRVHDAIQPFQPLSSLSPPAPTPSQHQSLFNESTLCMRWPKYRSFSFSIRAFSIESAVCIRWPEYCSFSFSISPSNEYSRLISFRIDWSHLLAA